jgi:hypothetical protein
MNFKHYKDIVNHYKVSCHTLPKIIGGGKGKLTDAVKANLKDTGKAILRSIYIDVFYKRKKEITSKYLDKGIDDEDKSISLYRKNNQIFTAKNTIEYSNDFIKGTPDLVLNTKKLKLVVDIKTCWDIWTYIGKTKEVAKKDYFWQLAGYSWLTGIKDIEIAYTLLSNSEYEMMREYERMKWSLGILEDGTEDTSQQLVDLEDKIRYNNTYDDIPEEKRLKVFRFEVKEEDYKTIENYVQLSREYLNKLKL